MYFFFVETKGLTLEELDGIFEAKNPRKTSTHAIREERNIIANAQKQLAEKESGLV